jgi:hypothetical protein
MVAERTFGSGTDGHWFEASLFKPFQKGNSQVQILAPDDANAYPSKA